MRSLLPALLAVAAAACADGPPPAPRVVLISLDTLRADHLPFHGYAHDTAPNLAAMAARDAVVFERCYSQASWTLPSHASMLTGLYPLTHGLSSSDKRLAPDVVTLAERLRDAGLATAAFTDGGYVAPGYGLEDGFEVYHDQRLGEDGGRRGLARSLPYVENWLREHRDQGFFLFLHTYDVHAPYTEDEQGAARFRDDGAPAPDDVERLEYLKGLEECAVYDLDRFEGLGNLVATYDAMIHGADLHLGRLFELLRELALYDDTLIVVTSDHGESFLDAGVYAGHGLMLNDAETHVPLLVKFPGNRFAGARSGALVESVDIAPTVLRALAIAPQEHEAQGHDLVPLLEGGVDPSKYAFSWGGALQSAAVRGPRWTLLESASSAQAEIVLKERLRPADAQLVRARLRLHASLLPAGASDGQDFGAAHPDVAQQLRAALAAWELAQHPDRMRLGDAVDRAEPDAVDLEHLRSLGYL
jgi:arylsulfatase A-like enzyme